MLHLAAFGFILVQLASSVYSQIDGQGCTPWGFPCNNSLTTCCSEGSWPGGRRNCYGSPPNLFCYCTIPGYQCQSDRQCCSNKCAKGKCDVGWKNDICDPKSKLPQCGEGLSCTPFAIEVGKIYETYGECLVTSSDCEGYGTKCYLNTQCCPVGSWKGEICQPASKNVVDDSQTFCHCRVGFCLQDGDCCSGKCAQHTCAPGNIDDLCDLAKGKNACKAGLKCVGPIDNVNIQRFLDKFEYRSYGRCYHEKGCLEFGAECPQNDLTTCCSYGKWPGGPLCRRSRNPHLSGRLFCLCSLFNCRDNVECCSGTCVDGMCTKSTELGSICNKDPNSCNQFCGVSQNETKFNEAIELHRLSEYGTCGCIGTSLNSVCHSDSECCSGLCFVDGGMCISSHINHVCILDDPKSTCMPGLICTHNGNLDSNHYGSCKLDTDAQRVGSMCSGFALRQLVKCAAVGSYAGGYDKCNLEEGNFNPQSHSMRICGCYVEQDSNDTPSDKDLCGPRPLSGSYQKKRVMDICHYGPKQIPRFDQSKSSRTTVIIDDPSSRSANFTLRIYGSKE